MASKATAARAELDQIRQFQANSDKADIAMIESIVDSMNAGANKRKAEGDSEELDGFAGLSDPTKPADEEPAGFSGLKASITEEPAGFAGLAIAETNFK